VRNRNLDAIRAFAILLVLIHHLSALPGPAPGWLRTFWIRGYIGVDLFFVLSGWLIAGQLFRAIHRDGRLDIGRFWARRWLRTLPAYYAVAVFLVVRAIQSGNERLPLGVAVFAQNYTAPHAWYITWSLCVEEHFYIALPLVLWVVRGRRWAAIAAGATFAVASPALRWMAYREMMAGTWTEYLDRFYPLTHLRLDGLVLGVVAAALKEYDTGVWRWAEKHARAIALGGFALLVASAYNPAAYSWDETDRMAFFAAVPSFFLVSLGVAALLPAAVGPQSAERRWWSSSATWLAEHAYALYLVHYIVYGMVGRHLRIPYPAAVAAALLGAAGCAWLLRRLIEVPGLQVRDWYEDRKRGRAVSLVAARER
jgi:peptidoglycan/LPS O-acetylase OafA/YrhL